MNTNEICLPRKLTNQLLHLAQISPNAEVCGLVGANADGLPTSCYPVNKPRCLVRQPLRFPDTPAMPSATDIAQASYPDAVHLIISLNTKGVLEMRAFKIIEQSVEELALRLIEV